MLPQLVQGRKWKEKSIHFQCSTYRIIKVENVAEDVLQLQQPVIVIY